MKDDVVIELLLSSSCRALGALLEKAYSFTSLDGVRRACGPKIALAHKRHAASQETTIMQREEYQ
jgi:hypothetical protein